MALLSLLEEKLYLPLKAAWAAKNGLSPDDVIFYTRKLLHDIDNLPSLASSTAIILGSTRATSFIVDQAIRSGHKKFILIGGKPICREHPSFTAYAVERMSAVQKKMAEDGAQTESQYAEKLLIAAGVPTEHIYRLPHDTSTNTGANMYAFKQSGFAQVPALQFYALAGSALRAFMTARKEFGFDQTMSVHNAYPTGVTPDNWHHESVACAHMAGEAVKALGGNPLYVRLGYAININPAIEARRGRQFIRKESYPTYKL